MPEIDWPMWGSWMAEIERLKAENERLQASNRWLDQQVTTLREQRDARGPTPAPGYVCL
jgi:hypothetical protein